MGTRGAFGYRIKGKDKVTYNHFDSYPSGLGTSIVQYARITSTEKMLEIAKRIKLVKAGSKPTKKQIEECKKYANLGVSTGKITEWYCLLREAQGEMEAYENIPYMIDSHAFLIDSLFCEWAYIVNLDTKKLEIYKGFNQNPSRRGRYASKIEQFQLEKREASERYYGVVLVGEIPLDMLHAWTAEEVNGFMADFQKKDDIEGEKQFALVEKPLKMAHSPDHD
jgi:hypothetical protein